MPSLHAPGSMLHAPPMREMWWIPDWVGEWADRNGNFRNFPVFAVFAALLFLAFNTNHAGLPRRSETKEGAAPRVGGFVFRSFRLPPVNCDLPTSKQSFSLLVPGLLVLRRAALCFCAATLLDASLEVAQLLLPHRWADWRDVLWSVTGAFAGAFAAMLLSSLSSLFRLKTVH